MPTATVWNDNTHTSYTTAADGDSLTVLPGFHAYLPSTIDTLGLLILNHGSTINNFGALIAAGSGTVVYTTPIGKMLTINNSGVMQQTGGSASAIYLDEGAVTINNSGAIEANFRAITAISSNSMTVNNTGLIWSHNEYAIAASWVGALSIVNTGNIVGGIVRQARVVSDSVFNLAGGTITGPVTFGDLADILRNAGTITGAVTLGGGANIFTNSGEITGATLVTSGVAVTTAVTAGFGANAFTNTGAITGDVKLGDGANVLTNGGAIFGAVSVGDGNDLLTNTGSIIGAVNLGAGNDQLDNTFGVITGTINAGLGDDRVIGGAGPEVIYGDNVYGPTVASDPDGGNDFLWGGWGDDLIYGGYGNDQLYGCQDDDVLYGNQGDDWMHGGQGDDALYGGQGHDVINGGKGDDVLQGNLGDDLFVFSTGFGHDVLSDLGNGAGDRVQFQPGTFADFADVQAHATQLAGGVLLTTATGDTVFIVGATTGGLSAAQFVFG